MSGSSWKRVVGYGAFLAAGTFALQWLDYLDLARFHSEGVYVVLVAIAFLALGIYLGARIWAAPKLPPFSGNPQAIASLGISPRELTVLQRLAAGQSNKEIAAELRISPNTIKTHVARLFDKLGAKSRTDAIKRARDLGIVR
jgi:DNA-binding NarL/FixJ family response regulator